MSTLPMFRETNGRYYLDHAPGSFTQHTVLGPKSEPILVYLYEATAVRPELSWSAFLASVEEDSPPTIGADRIGDLLKGGAVFFEGHLQTIANALVRIWRVLNVARDSKTEIMDAYLRCFLAVEHGRLKNVVVPELPAAYTPRELQPMYRASQRGLTFVPAALVCALYRDIFGRIGDPDLWFGGRFVDSPALIDDEILGCRCRVWPRVFVPDPDVIDLIVGASSATDSLLQNDFHEAVAFEPCSGTGVLARLLAHLGARIIHSTEIDPMSRECMRDNFERWSLTSKVTIHDEDWLPEGDEVDAVLVNPPWYGKPGDLPLLRIPHYRRCTFDFNHKLLRSLLRHCGRVMKRGSAFYVTYGRDNPFIFADAPSDSTKIQPSQLGWRLCKSWRSQSGLVLQRLAHL